MPPPEFGSGDAQWRGRAVRLLTGTVVIYWVALAALALWSPVRLYLRLRLRWPGHVTLGLSDRYGFAVTLNERPVWQASLTNVQAVAWVVGPPLLLWLLWLLSTHRRTRSPDTRAGVIKAAGGADSRIDAPTAAELSAGAHHANIRVPGTREPERQRARSDHAG